MFRRSWRFCALLIHSAKGVEFTLSSEEAVDEIKKKYGRHWFGANLLYLHLYPPKREFLPFYLASGHVDGVYTGRITYTTTTTTESSSSSSSSTSGKSGGGNSNTDTLRGTEREVLYSPPQALHTTFSENRTQVYGGFKYHMGHVHSVLRSEQLPLFMKSIASIDTTDATLNLFEQSYFSARDNVEAVVKKQVEELARSRLRASYPGADSIEIEFDALRIRTEELTPVFLPCYVVKAMYDSVRYTIYVSGRTGVVGGPYLLNALLIARVSSSSVLLLSFFLSKSAMVGIWYGMWLALPTYVVSFFGGKYYPLWRRNRNRQQREMERLANVETDERRKKREAEEERENRNRPETAHFSFNFRPNADTRRQQVRDAYQSSTFWDTHAFENRKTSSTASHTRTPTQEEAGAGSFSQWFVKWCSQKLSSMGTNSSSRTSRRRGPLGADEGAAKKKRGGFFRSFTSASDSTTSSSSSSSSSRPFPSYPADPKGYYRLLGLRGDESVNEIRSAYRKVVLQCHPDVGGSTEKMATINSAYRVLRDPARRAAYDLEKASS